MTTAQRNAVIQTLQKRQNENEGFLVLATSAIEAGCDFDAHLIVTELCNPDSLVQLAGRLNRRGTMPGAQLVLIGETIRPHVNVLNKEQLPRYLKDLHAMNGIFRPQGLSPYFIPPQKDWMGEILFDMLWNYVYEGDLTSEPLWKRGILVTRSWEPAITVCTGLDEQGRPQI
jgi:CRISPR-associated endonuclease/helicase Cas3